MICQSFNILYIQNILLKKGTKFYQLKTTHLSDSVQFTQLHLIVLYKNIKIFNFSSFKGYYL